MLANKLAPLELPLLNLLQMHRPHEPPKRRITCTLRQTLFPQLALKITTSPRRYSIIRIQSVVSIVNPTRICIDVAHSLSHLLVYRLFFTHLEWLQHSGYRQTSLWGGYVFILLRVDLKATIKGNAWVLDLDSKMGFSSKIRLDSVLNTYCRVYLSSTAYHRVVVSNFCISTSAAIHLPTTFSSA